MSSMHITCTKSPHKRFLLIFSGMWFPIDLNPLKGFIQLGNCDFPTAHLYTFLVQVHNSFMFIVYVETN